MSNNKAYNDFLLALDASEPLIADAFRELVRDLADGAMFAALVEAITYLDLDGILAALHIEEKVWSNLAMAVRDVFENGAKWQMSRIRVPKRVSRMAVRFDGRHYRAETIAKRLGGDLITKISVQARQSIMTAVTEGMKQGHGPAKIAKSLVGTIDKTTGSRVGSFIGLTGQQQKYVSNLRVELQELTPKSMASYFGRELRDRRYDTLVKQAYKDGTSLKASKIEAIVARYADRQLVHRAKTIARTEALSAFNAGRAEAAEQMVDDLGVPSSAVKSVWRATADSKRTRDTHKALNGTAVPVGGVFVSPSGARMRFPGDAELGAGADERANCRCTAEVVVDWAQVANGAR